MFSCFAGPKELCLRYSVAELRGRAAGIGSALRELTGRKAVMQSSEDNKSCYTTPQNLSFPQDMLAAPVPRLCLYPRDMIDRREIHDFLVDTVRDDTVRDDECSTTVRSLFLEQPAATGDLGAVCQNLFLQADENACCDMLGMQTDSDHTVACEFKAACTSEDTFASDRKEVHKDTCCREADICSMSKKRKLSEDRDGAPWDINTPYCDGLQARMQSFVTPFKREEGGEDEQHRSWGIEMHGEVLAIRGIGGGILAKQPRDVPRCERGTGEEVVNHSPWFYIDRFPSLSQLLQTKIPKHLVAFRRHLLDEKPTLAKTVPLLSRVVFDQLQQERGIFPKMHDPGPYLGCAWKCSDLLAVEESNTLRMRVRRLDDDRTSEQMAEDMNSEGAVTDSLSSQSLTYDSSVDQHTCFDSMTGAGAETDSTSSLTLSFTRVCDGRQSVFFDLSAATREITHPVEGVLVAVGVADSVTNSLPSCDNKSSEHTHCEGMSHPLAALGNAQIGKMTVPSCRQNSSTFESNCSPRMAGMQNTVEDGKKRKTPSPAPHEKFPLLRILGHVP